MQGIVFTGPMVRAILDGRKTETRRLKPWKPGLYYVKETFAWVPTYDDHGDEVSRLVYRASSEPQPQLKWKSGLFMPEAASRAKIVVETALPGNLGHMTADDIKKEGFDTYGAFILTWNELHRDCQYITRPDVWVMRFHVWMPGESNA